MINAFVNTFLKIIIWLVQTILNVILAPISLLLTGVDGHGGLFPSLTDYSTTINNFVTDYVIKGALFVKQVFLNITHFPSSLFSIAVGFIGGLFTFYFSLMVFRIVIGVYKIIRGVK